jgi:hypothetical protein
MTQMGASAYLGWDGEVISRENCAWACSLYRFVCDTPARDPYTCTVGAFMYKYFAYRWQNGVAGPSLGMTGDAFTTLQQAVPEGWSVDGQNVVFGFAGANYYSSRDELDVSLAANAHIPPGFPMTSITVPNASGIVPGMSMWPEYFAVLFGMDNGYDNWRAYSSAPLYVCFTEASLTYPYGKVSGFVTGSVYRFPPNSPDDTFPLPIYGAFTNVTVTVIPEPEYQQAGEIRDAHVSEPCAPLRKAERVSGE